MRKKRKIVIGITGRIGAGKTEVSKIFEKLGAQYISADEIGWRVLPDIAEGLKKKFGTKVLKQGRVDKKKLRKLIFSDKKALGYLNSLSHPLLTKKIIEELKKTKADIVVIDAALLFDWPEIYRLLDYSILVTADEDIMKKRAQKKGFDSKTFKQILKSQKSESAMAKRAQFIIENNGTVEALKKQCLEIYGEIKNGY